MAFPLPHYTKIKDNYCIVYQGPNDEFVAQLVRVRPYIEEQLPGIKIYIACKDELISLMDDQQRIFAVSLLKKRRNTFAYIRHLKSNLRDNPVRQLLEESDLLTPHLEKMLSEKQNWLSI